MSSAKLDALTPELFDIVLQDLGLDDIRQLRLVNKETCARATRDRFLSCTTRKRVEITPAGLETFTLMTSQGYRLGCSVRHLTLVGVLYDSSILEEILETGALGWLPTIGPSLGALKQLSEEEIDTVQTSFNDLQQRKKDLDEFRKTGTDIMLLSQAMQNLSSEPQCKLDTLSLEVVVYDGGAVLEMSPKHKSLGRYSKTRREQIFSTAMERFKLVSLALRENGPSIDRLEVFDRQSGPLPCKLPCDTFSQIEWVESKQAWASFRGLKSLSLHVSDRATSPDLEVFESNSVDDAVCRDQMPGQEFEDNARHISHLIQMQSLCPQLEDLRILWYRLLPDEDWMRLARRYPGMQAKGRVPSGKTWPRLTVEAQWRARQLYMHQLALATPFECLRTFHLGGLSLQVKDLLTFVQKHQSSLREVVLDNVQAVDDNFTPLFSLLACANTLIQRIHLENLQENLAAVYFDAEQRSEYTRISGDQWDNNIIERWGEDVTKQIEYSTRNVRHEGTSANWHAARDSIYKFGSIAAGMPQSELAVESEMTTMDWPTPESFRNSHCYARTLHRFLDED